MDFDSRNMQPVLSTEFREDTVWYHIKIKPDNGILSKVPFWLGADSEEEIYKILKRKQKLNKEDVEWVREETPPFVQEKINGKNKIK